MGASNIRGDRRALQRTMEAIISESRSAAQQLLPGLDRAVATAAAAAVAAAAPKSRKTLPEGIADLVFDVPAHRRLSELVLAADVVSEIQEFLFEFSHAALLRANSLEPRHTLLLVGPPGNGKTSLAEVLATELSLPLLSIRYDAMVDSFLGETSNRLRKLIEYATLHPCVLFFDEFDAVGKERSDAQETGEIKRVVSSLLVQMDRLPSHTVVVCATNHPELLDRAVWRRFEVKLQIDPPAREQLETWFKRFEVSLNGDPTGISPQEFAQYMAGENMSGVEAFVLDVRRKMVLSQGQLSAADAVRQVLSRLNRRLMHPINPREDGPKLSNRAASAKSAKARAHKGKEASLPKEDPLRDAG